MNNGSRARNGTSTIICLVFKIRRGTMQTCIDSSVMGTVPSWNKKTHILRCTHGLTTSRSNGVDSSDQELIGYIRRILGNCSHFYTRSPIRKWCVLNGSRGGSSLRIQTNRKELINACRLYLDVTLLSDIVNAEGGQIRNEILAGTRPVID